MTRRPLNLQTLETRQVMDGALANCLEIHDSQATTAELGATLPFDVSAAAMQSSIGISDPPDAFAWTNLIAAYPTTKVYRSESALIAISDTDVTGSRKLWVIHEGAQAGGQIAFSLDLGRLGNEQVLIDGNQLLVIGDRGSQFYFPGPVPTVDGEKPSLIPLADVSLSPSSNDQPGTDVLAINLQSGEVVKRFSLPSGYVKYADFADGQATILLQRNDLYVPMIWPPVKVNDELYRFTFDDQGIGETQVTQVPSGQVTVSGDRLFITTYEYSEMNLTSGPMKPASSLSIFELTNEGIRTNGTLDIGTSRLVQIQATDDRDQFALVTTSSGELSATGTLPGRTSIQLLDLGEETPVIVETITLPQPNAGPDNSDGNNDVASALIWWNPTPQLIGSTSRYLVFQSLAARSVTIVNLVPDSSASDRLLTVDLPEEIQLGYGGIEINNDRILFLSGPPYWNALPVDLNAATGIKKPLDKTASQLISLSLTEGIFSVQEINGDSTLGELQWIDPSSKRLGFIRYSSTTNERSFVFGDLDDAGRFVEKGAVEVRTFQETIYPFSETITIASVSGLKTYSYEDTTKPLYEVRFVDANQSPLIAQDDSIALYPASFDPVDNIQTDWIDLLANDQIPFYSQFSTQIVELIDAPPGVNLAAGRYVWLDSRIESLDEPLTFRYRVSDGISESTGEVEVKLANVSEEQRNQVLDSIKQSVSQQFFINPDQITIEAVAKIDETSEGTSPRDPNTIGADGSLPVYGRKALLSQSPWFVFRVTAPGFEAIYGSDLSDNAILLSIVKQEQQASMALTVIATDDVGTKIDTVDKGQAFWIEIQAADLRRLPQGTFSAFVTISLPAQFIATGDSESGRGLAFVGGKPSIENATDRRITLGVIDTDGSPLESLNNGSQTLLRFRVTAISSGAAKVAAAISENAGEETTLFESSKPLTADQVRVLPLSLQIRQPSPTDEPSDVDGDGEVRPLDALRVINMVSKHGVGTIEVIRQRLESSNSGQPLKVDVSRMDVNRDNLLTPLDALLVINRISQKNREALQRSQSESPVDQGMAAASAQEVDNVNAKRRKRV